MPVARVEAKEAASETAHSPPKKRRGRKVRLTIAGVGGVAVIFAVDVAAEHQSLSLLDFPGASALLYLTAGHSTNIDRL